MNRSMKSVEGVEIASNDNRTCGPMLLKYLWMLISQVDLPDLIERKPWSQSHHADLAASRCRNKKPERKELKDLKITVCCRMGER